MAWLLATEDGFRIGDFEVAREIAQVIEIIAIAVIVIGVAVSLAAGLIYWVRDGPDVGFTTFKRFMARGLLIGLDLLIAADVIKTVTLEGTLESAVTLGLLVLIRTFLSWTLVLEVQGHWPWQHPAPLDTS